LKQNRFGNPRNIQSFIYLLEHSILFVDFPQFCHLKLALQIMIYAQHYSRKLACGDFAITKLEKETVQ
jgi:hypothetical protein